jgi:tetratricopeptide (TPR) repeat protein/SAM-dependent methyltransferase
LKLGIDPRRSIVGHLSFDRDGACGFLDREVRVAVGRASCPAMLYGRDVRRAGAKGRKMSRKDRRAVPGRGMRPSLPTEADAMLATALGHHKAGQLALAEGVYRRILAVAPNHAKALHYLGVLNHQAGRGDAAIELIRRAIACDDGVAEFHYNLGVVLEAQKQLDEAAAQYRRTIELNAAHANAHLNLGNVLLAQNRIDEAEAVSRRAVAVNAGSPDARFNLGIALARSQRFEDAIVQFRDVVRMAPNHAAAHAYLGASYVAVADNERGADHCRRALALDPRNHQAAVHLGLTSLARGDFRQAVEQALYAFSLDETPQARYLFARAARHAAVTVDNPQFRHLVLRALIERWDRPSNLARPAVSLIRLNAGVRALIDRPQDAPPLSAGDFGAALADMASERLLRELLRITTVCDHAMEAMLTALRRGLLDLASDAAMSAVAGDVLDLLCALAQQCYGNEYVYALADDERMRAESLRERLAAAVAGDDAVPPLLVAAVGAYLPLNTLADADRLAGRSWPAPVAAVIHQQIVENGIQQGLRKSLPNLTPVEDATSLEVKRQYEENPYPRWIFAETSAPQLPLDVHFTTKFQRVGPAYKPFVKARGEILIAGCGTGQHAIETARRFVGCDVLAIDLSTASLAYAAYKTREIGLANVSYAVADILKLDSIGRTFDVIEAQGVLHHLADPLAAWRRLLSILRSGGLMNVGLYSAIAREPITRARTLIAEHGHPASADGIRRCRQDIVRSDDPVLRRATEMMDFFSISECRDLMFHVQEHRMTLPQIAAFIREAGLTFLCFDLDVAVFNAYEQRFPADRTRTDLNTWHAFELENPQSFVGMYQFWVQKP